MRPLVLVESIAPEKVTLLPFVSTKMAEPLFLMREEMSVSIPVLYCNPPPVKETLPEVPKALALPITTVPAVREVGPV